MLQDVTRMVFEFCTLFEVGLSFLNWTEPYLGLTDQILSISNIYVRHKACLQRLKLLKSASVRLIKFLCASSPFEPLKIYLWFQFFKKKNVKCPDQFNSEIYCFSTTVITVKYIMKILLLMIILKMIIFMLQKLCGLTLKCYLVFQIACIILVQPMSAFHS